MGIKYVIEYVIDPRRCNGQSNANYEMRRDMNRDEEEGQNFHIHYHIPFIVDLIDLFRDKERKRKKSNTPLSFMKVVLFHSVLHISSLTFFPSSY